MIPRVVILYPDGIEAATSRDPGTLYVAPLGNLLARRGTVVRMPKTPMLYMLALAARPGAIIPAAEIADLLYGHRPEGGPDNVAHCLSIMAREAKSALACLGYRHAVIHGRGHTAHAVLDLATASERGAIKTRNRVLDPLRSIVTPEVHADV